MAYQYPESPDETAAAELLRAKGWRVRPPMCNECHGHGMQSLIRVTDEIGQAVSEHWVAGLFGLETRRCPNGCERPDAYY